ncbi:MAG TPA: PAS domain-containing protein [Streptosporangiaceae bacterium]
MRSRLQPAVGGRLRRPSDRWRAAAIAVITVIAAATATATMSVVVGAIFGALAGAMVALGAATLAATGAAVRWRCEGRRAQRIRDQLLQVFDGTASAIYMKDLAGRYLTINRRFTELTGITKERVVGLTDHDMFPKGMADSFRANDLEALSRGARIKQEKRAALADGAHTYMSEKYPIADSAGRPYAVCGISTDITDLKRAHEKARSRNADLEQRVRERTAELDASTHELDAFIYSVSHDLRAPLRAAGEFSKILSTEYARRLDRTGQDYLDRVRSATGHVADLIDGLLEMSRAERTAVDRRPVDFGEIAHEVVVETGCARPRRRVTVDVEPGVIVAADPRLLRLTLRHLLLNARQFTARTPEPCVQVGATRRAGRRVFFVRDNGAEVAMPEPDGPFVLLERLASADDARGVGIRLAIAARVIARHGGQAWVESGSGQGTAIFFTLEPRPAEGAGGGAGG